MKLKNLLVVALLAAGSFTFANDSKKDEAKEVRILILNSAVNEETSDFCSITITVYRSTTVGGTTFVDEIEATGTGSDCAEAEADARAALNS